MRCSNRDSCTVKSQNGQCDVRIAILALLNPKMDNAMFESRFLHCKLKISLVGPVKCDWKTGDNITRKNKFGRDIGIFAAPPCRNARLSATTRLWEIIRQVKFLEFDIEKLSATRFWVNIRQPRLWEIIRHRKIRDYPPDRDLEKLSANSNCKNDPKSRDFDYQISFLPAKLSANPICAKSLAISGPFARFLRRIFILAVVFYYIRNLRCVK